MDSISTTVWQRKGAARQPYYVRGDKTSLGITTWIATIRPDGDCRGSRSF